MFLKRTQALLEAAAKPVLESIRDDRARAPRELQPLLSYVEEHLFDPSFSVDKMRTACGARDNSVVTRFRRQLGMPIRGYVKEHQLRVGRELLKQEQLTVWMIAELVGFSSPQLFSRNFGKRFGESPRAYRRKLSTAEPAAGVADRDFSVIELRQGLEGLLEPDRGRSLIRELQAHYPRDRESAATEPSGFDPEAVWETLRDLSPEDQLARIRQQHADAGRAMFELLSEKSRVEGRRDRQRGVQLAELALKSLDLCAVALGDELPGLRALGWARLGNARRLALGFTAAEEAFRQSAFEWGIAGACLEPGIEAEILALKAAFRAMLHRFSEAQELVDQALERLEPERQPRLLAQTLIVRASIAGAAAKLEASIVDLRRALELVEPDDGRLRLTICHNLATACMDAGRFSEAGEILPVARDLCSTHGEPLERFQLRWVEGRVAKGLDRTALAKKHFMASHSGFVEAGETAHAAVVAVELALIYCEHGRPEVLRYAAEAIPILDGFKIRSEAVAARRLLALALARKHVTPEVLREVRTALTGLVRDPAVCLPRTS